MQKGQKRTGNQTGDIGKLPPQAIELEEAVLGAMLLEKDGITIGITEIQFDDIFYKESHKLIFNAIKTLFSQSNPVDILTVTNYLRSKGELEMVGGAYYVTELTSKVNSATNIQYHIQIIKQKWIQRLIIKVSLRNLDYAYQDTKDVFELLEKSSMELLKLNQQLAIKKSETGKQIYLATMEEIASAMETPGMTGITTGIPELDRITGGWQSPDLVIIAARPGMGKTAFVMSTVKNSFLTVDSKVLIFSLEMTSKQLMARLIAGESEFSGAKLKKGYLEPQEFIALQTRTAHLYTDNLIIDDTPSISIGQLRAKAIAEKIKNPTLSIIVVDYLQLMKGSNPKQNNREQEISEISSGLKSLAKELNVPVLALSQLSRGVETRTGPKKPQLSDLRESGAIEQDADVVIFIYRAEYYKIETYEDGSSTANKAEIIYGKNRHGPTAEVTIGFKGALFKFHSIEETERITKENHSLFSMPSNIDNFDKANNQDEPNPF